MNAGVYINEYITDEPWLRGIAITICILDLMKGMIIGYFKEGRYESCTVTITHKYVLICLQIIVILMEIFYLKLFEEQILL